MYDIIFAMRGEKMVLRNKLGIDNAADLAREEERISKKKARELFVRVEFQKTNSAK